MAQTFNFMTKMRATSSAEEKKKLLTARQEAMKKLSPEERKKVSRRPQGRARLATWLLTELPLLEPQRSFAFWSGYRTMYKEYCETVRV